MIAKNTLPFRHWGVVNFGCNETKSMLEFNAPEIALPSDVKVSLQIEHSTFRLGISSKINKLLSQMEILFYYCLFGSSFYCSL